MTIAHAYPPSGQRVRASENAPDHGVTEDNRSLSEAIRAPRRAGLLVMAVFLGGLGWWGSMAPLAGGAIAPGRISPDSGVRSIEHLEGGLVSNIRVRDGDRVRAGDILLTVDVTATRAEAAVLADRRLSLLAEQARLVAELAGSDALDLPEDLSSDTPGLSSVLAGEQQTFAARRALRVAQQRVFEQRISQLSETLTGHRLQAESAAEQLALMREELADKTSLLEKGLAAKAEVLRLRRAIAELRGLRGSYLTKMAEARQEIGEIELNLKARDAEESEKLAIRASEARKELAEIAQRLSALQAILDRERLVAPVDGTISNLRVRNAGEILQPGQPVLDVVPVREGLLIDAQVAPNDIDAVAPGMTAQLRISAYSGRTLPRIEGQVTMVSADTSIREPGGTAYYPIRVEVDAGEISELGIDLRSGMLVSVLIVTRERSMGSYLLEPIRDLLQNAMREV